MAGIKQCCRCKKHLLPDLFSKQSSKCKPCAVEATKEWRCANPERAAASRRAWLNRDANQERVEGYRIKYRYNLTIEGRNELSELQGHKCAICKTDFDAAPRIDHCHTSGEVRGLLCDLCNRGLGYFKDNPTILTAAASYVKGVK